MSSVVARRVASTPTRTASDTWAKIIALVAPDPLSSARAELVQVASVASSSIACEATADDPIVVYGGGVRVRVYCVFGDGAIVGDDVNEEPLQRCPTEGDWKMSIPCAPEDLQWAQAALAANAKRVSARATGAPVRSEDHDQQDPPQALVNLDEFFRS